MEALCCSSPARFIDFSVIYRRDSNFRSEQRKIIDACNVNNSLGIILLHDTLLAVQDSVHGNGYQPRLHKISLSRSTRNIVLSRVCQ